MLKNIFFSVIGLLLLFAMNDVMNEIINQKTFHMLHFLQLNILYVLFGILIQRKRFEKILYQKSIQPNRFLLPALILIVISLIPNPFWSEWFSHNAAATLILINPLTHMDTHSILGVFSGTLFIKSLDT